MTVRSDKSNIFVVAVAFVCGAIVPVMILRDGFLAVGWGLLIADLVFCARWTVSIFRTLSFTQAGITVTFWRWKKEIPWNEVTVRVENYENSLVPTRDSCKESVVFATKRTHKPASVPAGVYSIFFHPFSYVYVDVQESLTYPVDKQEFLEMLSRFGVEWVNIRV